ncbi:MAG: hypothetical protein ACK5FU_04900 [Bacteroidota bacterium]|jgi:hypothetical protein|nr:hypothetical protein [Sphingobacteriales bacterium]
MKYLLLFVCLCSLHARAQQVDSLTRDTLSDAQIRLEGLGQSMIQSLDEKQRLVSGRNFLITLGRALRIRNSYYFKFDSVKVMSCIYSPDNRFRIFTWNIVLTDETFHYYGVVQLNPEYIKTIKDTSGLKSFYPLIDRSSQIKNPLDTTVGADFWFGANYYSIIPVEYKKQTYYTLLGWNGHTKMSNKKVVDFLYFENNKPLFGKPVFDLQKKKPYARLIYEFSNTATQTLKYVPKKKYLIIEAVVPTRPQDYGHPETYLPDGSYDYLIFNTKTGIWELKGLLRDFNFE